MRIIISTQAIMSINGGNIYEYIHYTAIDKESSLIYMTLYVGVGWIDTFKNNTENHITMQ